MGHLLLHAVLKDCEIFPLQVGDESPLTVHYANRDRNKTCINADDVSLGNFLRSRIYDGI